MKKIIFLFLFVFCFISVIDAQIEVEGTPLTLKKKSDLDIPNYDLPSFNLSQYKEEIKGKNHKKLHFARMFDLELNLTEVAAQEETENGTLYLFSLSSKEAYSLYIIFNEFNIPPGARLFLYNPDYSHVIGALTSKNNKSSGVLPVTPVKGEKVIIEYFEPHDVQYNGQLTIGKVGHDFLNVHALFEKEAEGLRDADDCNVNINCSEGDAWQDVKGAVTKIIAGGYLCSGSLINNSAFDQTPYLLTANHCIDNKEVAENAVFIFNFESPECDTTYYNMSNLNSLSGAELVGTPPENKLDFTLVELTSDIPSTYEAYLAGWNLDTNNIYRTTTIHHPVGDVKKITIDHDPPAISNYGDTYDKNTHWRVKEWDKGTTEGGSSGAPLFDQNHRIIGDLTGGMASCDYNYNDYFSMIYYSWNTFGEPEHQLKHWLDPDKTGFTNLDGYKPYQDRPSGLRVLYSGTQVELQWNSLINSSDLAYYEVFRNGENLTQAYGTGYTDNLPVQDSVYFYKVRAYKNSGQYTAFSDSVGIVPIKAIGLAYNYSFENPPAFETGWFENSSADSSLWGIDSVGTGINGSSEGSYHAAFDKAQDSASWLVSPKLNMGNSDYVILNFDLSIPQISGRDDNLNIYVRYNDSRPWKKIKSYTSAIDGWEEQTIYLPRPSDQYLFAFEAIGSNGGGIYLDHVQVYQDPNVVNPTFSASKDTICSLDTVTISLDTTDVFNSYSWDMGYGANPRYVDGYGPHEIRYTFQGEKKVQLITNGRYETLESDFIKVHETPAPIIQSSEDSLLSNYEKGNQWYRNGEIIDGATDQYYVVDQEGTYKVLVVNENGCSAFSNEIKVDDVGFEDKGFPDSGFKIYPNPSGDYINIELTEKWKGSEPLSLRIYDLNGNLLKIDEVQSNKLRIPIKDLVPGMYLLRIFDSTGSVYNKTFIKK